MQKQSTIVSKLGYYRRNLENLLNVKSKLFNKVNKRNEWVYNDLYTTKGVKSDVVEVFKFFVYKDNATYSIGFQYLNVNDENTALITVSLKNNDNFIISKTFDYKTLKTYLKLFIYELKAFKTVFKNEQTKFKSIQEVFEKTFGSFELGSTSLIENCKKELETELLSKEDLTSKVSNYLKTFKIVISKKEELKQTIKELRKELGIDELEILLAKKTKELNQQLSKQKEELKTLEDKKYEDENLARNTLSQELKKRCDFIRKYPLEVIKNQDITLINKNHEKLIFGLQKQISKTVEKDFFYR